MAEQPTPLRILLVEDNEHDVNAFRRAFRDSHPPARISHCGGAEEAIKLLDTDAGAFDVVVADYNLTGLSGLELCKEVVANGIPLPVGTVEKLLAAAEKFSLDLPPELA